MRFSRAALAAALASAALFATLAPALACFVCDEVVELDETRAGCFRRGYDAYLKDAQRSETSHTQVDLSACAGSDGAERRGVVKMADPFAPKSKPDAVPASELRSVYILDQAGIVCLKRLLDKHQGRIDPSVRFDLLESCDP